MIRRGGEYSAANGEIGEVYAEPAGDKLADESEHSIGWRQVSDDVRMKVVRVRGGHMWCFWKRATS